MSEPSRTALTTAMRAVLIAAAAIVVAGIAVTIWLLASASGSGDPQGQPGGTVPAATPTRGPIPGATPTTGSEVLPPAATAPPNRLPSRTPAPPTAPLVPAPLPKSAAAEGGLVAGFPSDLMGPVKGSDVVSSSIATEGATMQVSLVARSDASAKDLRSHYDELWASLGLKEASPTDGNLSYTGAHESLTLAVEKTGTGNRYSIFGVFRTK